MSKVIDKGNFANEKDFVSTIELNGFIYLQNVLKVVVLCFKILLSYIALFSAASGWIFSLVAGGADIDPGLPEKIAACSARFASAEENDKQGEGIFSLNYP